MSNRKLKIQAIALGLIASMGLTGCSSLKSEMSTWMNNNKEIHLSVEDAGEQPERLQTTWVELDQLDTFPKIRSAYDEACGNIVFSLGSKNGVLFVDSDTGDTNGAWKGNNTLYSVFKNKNFENLWGDASFRQSIADATKETFPDVAGFSDGYSLIMTATNAYFNIFATNSDGTSGMSNIATRAEAMTGIYKSDHEVTALTEDDNFTLAVGNNSNNLYAQNEVNNSYLKTDDSSLNYDTYNSPITRAEVLYLLMNEYYPSEMKDLESQKNSLDAGFTDVTNGGDMTSKLGFTDKFAHEEYVLEYCLRKPDKLDSELYKALYIAKEHGIIKSKESKWYKNVTVFECLDYMVNTIEAKVKENGYTVAADMGSNAGTDYYAEAIKEAQEAAEANRESINIEGAKITKIRDLTKIDDLLKECADEIDMTDEEIAEAKANVKGFTFTPVDKYMYVSASALNVRTGPNTSFRIIKTVPHGDKAHIVGICNETRWFRVLIDGKIAYQCNIYFSDKAE